MPSIEVRGLSKWYGSKKALGISIGMSVPALPYVVLLTAILV